MSTQPQSRLIVVPVAVDASDRVLLCKMAPDRGVFPGQWALPGGAVEPGEAIEDALRRLASAGLLDPMTQNNGHGTDERAIRQTIGHFIDAYGRGDVKALMAVYSEDLVKLRYKANAESKRQTGLRLEEFFTMYSGRLTVRNDEIAIHGNLAFTRGTFDIVAVPKSGGEQLHIVRRFVELWRKEQTGWKVARIMDAET